MIYVQPCSGLANRMRVIASVVELAEKTNTEVCVLWDVLDWEMATDFYELFENDE